jgi:hypothetical protein
MMPRLAVLTAAAVASGTAARSIPGLLVLSAGTAAEAVAQWNEAA